eukprot:TRINITY_DN63293_c0_g1_i1.p1 TRINITY_DN63293_c0_g1~~TRINITY_DN63293_c0_g1_i1.p1  ORF type:complete len:397 (-),score=38.40 TRINITY_DN63293_c0_g1_i1:75-1265(-)
MAFLRLLQHFAASTPLYARSLLKPAQLRVGCRWPRRKPFLCERGRGRHVSSFASASIEPKREVASAEAAQEFYAEEEVTKKGDEAVALFSTAQRYLFDLNGFLVLRGVLTHDEVAAANAAIDAHICNAHERTGILRNTRPRTPLAGDGVGCRMDMGGMLGWERPHCDVFRSLLVQPRLVPALTALCGPGYRMDHLPLLLLQNHGSEGFALHGGPLDGEGRFNPTLQYRCMGNDMFNSLLAVSVQLSDHNPGEGGFCVVRGSHKSNFSVPKEFVDGSGELGADHLHQPATRAGDVILFSEATVHGALPWTAQRQRRVALYRFAPATVSYSRAYSPQWPASVLEGLSPSQRAVLEPPYACRLDRPVLTTGGDEDPSYGSPRPEVKKNFDHQVFGQRYF